MTALPTPKLADLDDPLAPRREPQPAPQAQLASQAPSAPRQAARRTRAARSEPVTPARSRPAPAASLADEQLVGVFGRMPESLSDRLDEGVLAVNAGRPRRGRVSKQDILGALVDHYVTPEDAAALGELVDAYRQRIRR